MRKFLFIFCFILLSGVSSFAVADDISDLHAKAEQGDAEAQSFLGEAYYLGIGVPQDYSEAAKWYRLVAEQGDADAQYNLGIMYVDGQGVSQDYGEAVKWYRLAAAQGDARAQYNLGVVYLKGRGTPKSYIHAYMWWNIAQANGADAESLLEALESELTPAQIVEAQKLAIQCIESGYKNCY